MVEDEKTSTIDGFLGFGRRSRDDADGSEEPAEGHDDDQHDDDYDDAQYEDEPRRTTKRQWLILLAGLVVFIVCVVAAVLVVRATFGGDAEGTPVAWRDSVVDGNTVTVSWDASPCAEEGRTSVEETSDAVVITVREVPRQALCSSPGDVKTTTVELDEPVGDRDLVDGSIGE